jgi:hypothetical protein
MRIELSYEERILNALSRVKHKRTDDRLARDSSDFAAIRAILQPLYDELAKLQANNERLKLKVSNEISVLQTVIDNLDEAL